MAEKHYWKRNEIKYLGELVEKNTGMFGIVKWYKITDDFNFRYDYDLSKEDLQLAYDRYYGGGKKKKCQ